MTLVDGRGLGDVGGGRPLGRRFRWLWASYAVSTYGTYFGLGAFSLIAIRVLDAGPAAVSALPAAGLAVGAVLAVPLGPWTEHRRKRPVMIGADLVRFGALASVPAAYALGRLTLVHLLAVSVVAAAAKIAFQAASGAYLKALLPPDDLLVANGRFESTTWTAAVLGPPLGGAAIGFLGPVASVLADAVSYLLSALGIGAIGGGEARPVRSRARTGPRPGDLLDGWRHLLSDPVLRPLFFNALLVNGLIMATEPLLAVLLLDRLGFAAWQYGLAFAAPCAAGLAGSRLARRFVARSGYHRVLLAAGTLRACWLLGLAFVPPGAAGIALVIAVESGLIFCASVFNPVLATYRLDRTAKDRVARTLSAWSVSGSLTIAGLTVLWGLLAAATGPRTAIAAAGILSLATPLLLPRRDPAPRPDGVRDDRDGRRGRDERVQDRPLPERDPR